MEERRTEAKRVRARDGNCVLTPCQFVQVLNRREIDLIVHLYTSGLMARGMWAHVEAADVFAIALDDVDEVVDARVFAEEHLAVVDLVLVQNVVDNLGWIRTQLNESKRKKAGRGRPW